MRGGWQAALALAVLLGAVSGARAQDGAPAVALETEASPGLPAGTASPAPNGAPASTEAPDPTEAPAPTDASRGAAAPADLLSPLAERWRTARPELHVRVEALRDLAGERGLANLEPAARLLLLDESLGTRLERSRAAVALAPDLPAAHAALAAAHVSEGRNPAAALDAALATLRALPRHLEASLWFGALGFWALAWALPAAGLGFIALCAARSVREAAHDLGDRLERGMPLFARAAALGALALLPASVGEGALGLGLSAFAVAFAYGDAARRLVLTAAAALVVVGLYPIADSAGRYLAAPASDAVAESAWVVERGVASPLDARRLDHAGDDPLALRARALQAKRSGDFALARERYAVLLEQGAEEPAVLNNAANVWLALGELDGAIALYQRAASRSESAPVWFNLAQAYGRAIRVGDHEDALARAQVIDDAAVRALTERLAASERVLLTDLPLSARVARARLLDAEPGRAAAASMRRSLAPGRLGADPRGAAGAFAAAALLAWLLVRSFRPSSRCRRCGDLLCPRCGRVAREGLCEGCARMLHRPETLDPKLRDVRARGLARRERGRARWYRLASLVMPGAAGVFGGRPLLGLLATLGFTGVWGAVWALGRPLPDPLVAGHAAWLVFGGGGLVLALVYLATTGAAYKLRRGSAGS